MPRARKQDLGATGICSRKLYLVSLPRRKNSGNRPLHRSAHPAMGVCRVLPAGLTPHGRPFPGGAGASLAQPRLASPSAAGSVCRQGSGRGKWAPSEESRNKSCCHPEGRRIGMRPPVSHPTAQADMLLSGCWSSAAAAAATVWTLEQWSRAGQELPVCEGDVDEKLFSLFH